VIRLILKSSWTYTLIRLVGFGLLGGYLFLTGDWRISVTWVLAFLIIALAVAILLVNLDLSRWFPTLDKYYLFPNATVANSNNEWSLNQARRFEGMMGRGRFLLAPAEDGLICVPVLLAGLGVASSALGGLVFGLLHLGRFTYLECIGKSFYYTLVCIFVLPHGLLTVALGHVLMDAAVLAGVKVAKRRLASESRSNTAVKGDAPQAARPLP
jgi:hypothetical protein